MTSSFKVKKWQIINHHVHKFWEKIMKNILHIFYIILHLSYYL